MITYERPGKELRKGSLTTLQLTPEGGDGGGEEAEAEQQHELGHGSVVTAHLAAPLHYS